MTMGGGVTPDTNVAGPVADSITTLQVSSHPEKDHFCAIEADRWFADRDHGGYYSSLDDHSHHNGERLHDSCAGSIYMP